MSRTGLRVLKFSFAACLAMLAACAPLEAPAPHEDAPRLSLVSFSDLPGWAYDDHAGALGAFLVSCGALGRAPADREMTGGFAGRVADWQTVCAAASQVPPGDVLAARRFFESAFKPYAVSGRDGHEGMFTGYYQPLLRGSLTRQPPYLTPIYARPADMVTVNLGDFAEDLRGRTLQGRVVGENLLPYHPRAAIAGGAIAETTPAIVWVDDPVDAFFLHIQGSGVVTLAEGGLLQVGYAAQNGHPYQAIGRVLVERGEMALEDVSMQSIRAWLAAHPHEAPSVMNLNASYVFFRILDGDAPLGAQGVPLTSGRSLAVDRRFLPYGLPLYLDAEAPEGDARLQRLMVAQDTGGAIRGVVRGDYFWGAGEVATHKAGLMKSRGRYYALLPRTVDVPREMLR